MPENLARKIHVKCGFQCASCEEVPMCKVPGKMRGHAVLFTIAELLVIVLNGDNNLYKRQVLSQDGESSDSAHVKIKHVK